MVAWVRDWISRERKAKRTVRELADEIEVKHPYILSLENAPRARLGPAAEQGVAKRFFGGSKDAFRKAALEKFSASNLVVLPAIKGGTRITADPETVKVATEILIRERGIKSAASVAAVVPFTFFSSEEDARNVVLVVNALYESIKGPGAASRAGDRSNDPEPPASQSR